MNLTTKAKIGIGLAAGALALAFGATALAGGLDADGDHDATVTKQAPGNPAEVSAGHAQTKSVPGQQVNTAPAQQTTGADTDGDGG